MKDYWGLIAWCLGMEVGEDRPFRFAKELPGMAKEWDDIRQKHGLIAPDLETYLGQSGQFSDFVCARAPDNASAMSTIKVRQAGFNDTLCCDEMLRKWFELYQQERLLPEVAPTAMP